MRSELNDDLHFTVDSGYDRSTRVIELPALLACCHATINQSTGSSPMSLSVALVERSRGRSAPTILLPMLQATGCISKLYTLGSAGAEAGALSEIKSNCVSTKLSMQMIRNFRLRLDALPLSVRGLGTRHYEARQSTNGSKRKEPP